MKEVGGVKTVFHPAAAFAGWTAKKLRQDLFIQDLDLVIRDRKGNYLLLEIKARKQTVTPCQRITLSFLNAMLANSNGQVIDLSVGQYKVPTVAKYWGCHLLQFEKDEADFSGRTWFDNEEIEEEELIDILNFQMNITTWKQSKSGEAATDK